MNISYFNENFVMFLEPWHKYFQTLEYMPAWKLLEI
jgi:hypothetical protein